MAEGQLSPMSKFHKKIKVYNATRRYRQIWWKNCSHDQLTMSEGIQVSINHQTLIQINDSITFRDQLVESEITKRTIDNLFSLIDQCIVKIIRTTQPNDQLIWQDQLTTTVIRKIKIESKLRTITDQLSLVDNLTKSKLEPKKIIEQLVVVEKLKGRKRFLNLGKWIEIDI